MNLRELAEKNLGDILENGTMGFGWPITVTNPAGVSAHFTGFSDDIAQVIDPDTGVAVSGRMASVAIRISTITSKGLELPKGIADSGSKPWIVEFNDINGNAHKFKVSQSNPDRALGLVTLLLEIFK